MFDVKNNVVDKFEVTKHEVVYVKPLSESRIKIKIDCYLTQNKSRNFFLISFLLFPFKRK